FGYFPCPVKAADRCAFSRQRLEMLGRQGSQQKNGDGLLKQLHIDYNIPPCPHGGVYVLDADGKVSCSLHSRSQPSQPVPAPQEK
ncbi:MAG TPA: hypothetical protein PKO06_17845, partial [Candidatus Ozemobacteraceae bacterium]|nr:hypothetical protein [Candidatus Ozemobacteraceae bacterium]